MNVHIEESWRKVLQKEFSKPYFRELEHNLKKAYLSETVYPAYDQIFKAFNLCPFSKVTVVILGQDPYHGEGQANGLAFSVNNGIKIPPSLQNIYKEIIADVDQTEQTSGDLTAWAKQGVLLLNSTLTVKKELAGSHQHLGWETFTDSVIETISSEKVNVVFILWGSFAMKKRKLINEDKHLVITSAHPSPLSAYRGFFGSKPFSKTNVYLATHQLPQIVW